MLAELDRVEAVAGEVEVGAGGTLFGPLASARNTVVDGLDQIPGRLDDLRTSVGALRRLLAGPTDYLIVVGNNAEMRAGAGMPLQAGVATITNGDIAVSDFKSTVSDLYVRGAKGVAGNPPVDLKATYPRLESRRRLRRDRGHSQLSGHGTDLCVARPAGAGVGCRWCRPTRPHRVDRTARLSSVR